MPLFRNTFIPTLLLAFFSFSFASGHCDSTSSSAFILSPQIFWLDNGPLDALIKKESTLQDRSFRLRQRSPVFMLGFGGIHDHGNGLRTGFSLHGGYKSFTSETYTGGTARNPRDSVVMLRLIPAYGGFTFEKSYTAYDMTFSAGTMIGGGIFCLYRKFYDVEEAGAFSSAPDSVEDDDAMVARDWAFAPTFAFDFHAGVSYRLSPLLHLGIEAVALCFYSPEGYGYATGEFFTFNPGLRLRLCIGKSG